MKIIHFLKSKLYQDNKVKSTTQLENDFLEFPPFPLQNSLLTSEFTVVKVYGIGRLFYYLKMFYNFLFKRGYAINKNFSDSSVLMDMQRNTRENLSQVKEAFSNMKKEFEKQIFLKRILVFVSVIILSPIMVIALLMSIFYFTIRFGVVLLRINKNTLGNLGVFLPLIEGQEVVIVRPDLARKRKVDISAVLSHEHIHFLQYKNDDSSRKSTINSPEVFIKEKLLTSYILYLFERNEVEARLHELVLSYYRKFRQLPLELEGFVGIFLASREISHLLKNLVGQGDFPSPSSEEEMFFIREKDVADDLELILLSIKKEDQRCKFVTEVMATMYGNLLKLYGDQKSSNSFNNQIGLPNLYDRLYG
ncbi:MAG: hypothetical protein ACQEXG_16665 [Pseudomonadota bacterium]